MIHIGILGTGFGKEHLRLFSQTTGCRILKVYGRTPDTIETPLCYDLEDAEQIRETAVKMNKHVYVSSFIKFF